MQNVYLYNKSPTTLLAGPESSCLGSSRWERAHFQPAHWFLTHWLWWGLNTSSCLPALDSQHLTFPGPSEHFEGLPDVLHMSCADCLPAAHTRAWLWATQRKYPEQNLWASCFCVAFHGTLNCSVDSPQPAAAGHITGHIHVRMT